MSTQKISVALMLRDAYRKRSVRTNIQFYTCKRYRACSAVIKVAVTALFARILAGFAVLKHSYATQDN